MPDAAPKVYIVVLNFRAKEDTVGCLLSLRGLTYRPFEVIVVDNASGDGSLEFVEHEVRGKVSFPVHFIQSPRNDGFAAGNNIGLRFALARNDARYFWLLNNDTEVAPGSLTALVDAAEEDRRSARKVGQYGAKLLYHDQPDTIQAVGGRYNPWLGVTQEIGNLEKDRGQYDQAPPDADILIGASIFVTDHFLAVTGLLREDYFLYYEEHDWAVRGRSKGWQLRIVPACVVYHKHGASIGGGRDRGNKSALSDFYAMRNRLLFTARYYPWCLPTVYVGLLGVALRRVQRGQWNRLPMLLRLMFTFFAKPRFRSAS